jgi:HEPN domain-containing protein
MPKTSKAHAMFFFLRAGEFFSAAEKLFASESRAKAPNRWEYPIYFCYSHAVELALKAFLRSHKPEVEFGHELTKIYKQCVALGLVIDPDDRTHIGNIVTLLDNGNEKSGFRYFMGSGALPDLAWTREVVGRLIEAVELHVMRTEKDNPSGLGKVVGIRRIIGKPPSPDSRV